MFKNTLKRCVFHKMLVGWMIASALNVALSFGQTAPQPKPNILIIMADDCTFSELPVYGGKNAKTPTIDKLADEGLVFNRAYLSSAMCQPCRAELYSGQYPVRNGCSYNHSASKPDTRSLPHYLGSAGYRVGIAGKVHVLPQKAFPFEDVPGFDDNCVRNPTRPHQLNGIEKFMSRNDEPFCLVVALVEPHVPWVMGDKSAYPPSSLKIEPYMADTPQTRKDYSSYLAEITYMDSQVNEILQTLKKTGNADNTLVLFTSEQGAQFPGCKWTNWDTGLHTALIARWPGHVDAGKRTDAIVQYTDVVPTLLELAGVDPKKYADALDGTSFASVLSGQSQTHRKYAYGVHNNIPEGPAYPIRTVTNGQFRYIRNLTPDAIYIERHLMGPRNQYWPTWVAHASDDPVINHLVTRYLKRPAEQLYNTKEDQFELVNLADDPKYANIKKELSAELDRWMSQQKDPGAAMDTPEVHKAAKQGKHRY
jgi:N-sulfoglucosamine sulfohydrolase